MGTPGRGGGACPGIGGRGCCWPNLATRSARGGTTGRAAGCPANERWGGGGGPPREPAGRGGGPIGTPGRACGATGRGAPGASPEPVEPGGGVGAGEEPGARFAGMGWRGPESTCPGRGEPAAGIGRGGGGTGRPGAAGESEEAGRGAPTGG